LGRQLPARAIAGAFVAIIHQKTAGLSWRWYGGAVISAWLRFLAGPAVFSTVTSVASRLNTLSGAQDSWNISGYHAVVAIIS
jgi:hypothetical protein